MQFDAETLEARPIRHPNGFWWGPKGPRHTRVSAVLVARNIRPWHFVDREPVMWHNPWATLPMPEWNLPSAELAHTCFVGQALPQVVTPEDDLAARRRRPESTRLASAASLAIESRPGAKQRRHDTRDLKRRRRRLNRYPRRARSASRRANAIEVTMPPRPPWKAQ
jgi:hypothetical protein